MAANPPPPGPRISYEVVPPAKHKTWSFFAPPPAAPLPPQPLAITPEMAESLRALVEKLPEPGEKERQPRAAAKGPAEAVLGHVAPPAAAAPVEKRAVWIVHGMGQQVPFETLDSVAEGLRQAIAGNDPNIRPFRTAQVKFSDPTDPAKIQVVQRVEFDYPLDPSQAKRLEFHLYEAYWAPLTEGVPKLVDVIRFLLTGGGRGLLNCWKPFLRYMFPSSAQQGSEKDGVWSFTIPRRSAFAISFVLLVLLALVAINTVIVVASAAKFEVAVPAYWPIGNYWPQLTAMASAISSLLLTFGAVLFLAEMSKPADLWACAKRIVWLFSWVSVFLSGAAVIVAGFFMSLIHFTRWKWVAQAFDIHWHAVQLVSNCGILAAIALCAIGWLSRATSRSAGERYRESSLHLALFLCGFLFHAAVWIFLILVWHENRVSNFILNEYPDLIQQVVSQPGKLITFLGWSYWVWPALAVLSKLVRDLMVEYPGDVAVYVTPNQLDRFDETRNKIKQVALDTLMPLFAAREDDDSGFLYSKVAIIGHSLGSVIAYDTLNKLLVLDDLLGNTIHVADRVAILETFGSPLDKVAFFFNVQGKDSFHVREWLAAAVQPLILNYAKYRRFPWVNVYSHNDIISGDLKLFDTIPPPGAALHPIQPVEDPDAIVPLIAHTQYWNNATVWQELLKAII